MASWRDSCKQPAMHFIVFLFLLVTAVEASAYESDQYTNRLQPVADSLVVMDKAVNDAIEKILRSSPNSQGAVAKAIYHEIGGLYWADKIERWAAKSPEVEKYDHTRYESIYRGMPFWATRVNFVFGIGLSFRINDVMVGSDKLGHFFSQGYKYFRRELRDEPRERILAKGRFAERWIWGLLTTGVYSNADLVANYEGWQFYQSLFNDDVVPGKKSILVLQQGKYVQQRAFTWADHINDYWDEALNPSYNVESLNKRLRQSIMALCPVYFSSPEHFEVKDDELLWARYNDIGLRDNRRNRFDIMCER